MACNYCGARFAALVAPPSGRDLNSVDLRDSRIQHLNYLPIDIDGYVGYVTDEGSAVSPKAIPCCRVLSMGELDNGQLDMHCFQGWTPHPVKNPFSPAPPPKMVRTVGHWREKIVKLTLSILYDSGKPK